jgi:hypothetical protein
MVAQGVTWVDVEGLVRTWARSLNLADGRVFFGVNGTLPASSTQIVVQRIGGPDEACLVQFDVWGPALSVGQARRTAASLAAELATALDAVARYVTDDAILHGALVESSRWLPDEESDRPRYIVEATVTVTAT